MKYGIIADNLAERTIVQRTSTHRNAYAYTLLSGGLLLVLVLPFIGRPYWDDELFSVRTASGLNTMLDTFRQYENNMALYYWMLLGWIKLFGVSEIATRSLSLIFAILSLVAYQRLANRFFASNISFLSGLVLLLNPLFLCYSIETRSYSLMILLGIVSTDLFLRLLTQRKAWHFVLYGLTLSAAVYSHYFGALMIPVHAAVMLFWRSRPGAWKDMVMTWALVALSVSPLAIFRPASTEQINWIGRPDLKTAIAAAIHLFGSAGIMIALAGIWSYFRIKAPMRAGRAVRDLALLALTWIFLPLALTFFFSLLVKPVFQERYLVASIPAAALLAGHVMHKSRLSGWPIHWLLAVLLAFQAFNVHQTLDQKGSGFDQVTAYIDRNAGPKDMVLAYPFFRADHYSFYLGQQSPSKQYLSPVPIHSAPYLPGGGGRDPDPDLARLDSLSAHRDRSFLICNIGPREADGRQNRTWLPEIDKVLSRHYTHRDTIVFRPDYILPVRLIVYSK
jgi:mannosyltransferase